ncbi:hypothetical protein EIK77_005854 [Talaromyces pinophilus]|jgi:hypothetical protein|nr:hypothetical protein EIK77_005854 [Talaromyces pinophilus]
MLFHADYNRPGLRRDALALTGSKAKRAIKRIQRDIRTISENGRPFFTKDAIRDVCYQLNRSTEKGHKITIRGLDDMPVEFTLVTGDISSRIVRGDGDDDDEKEGQEKGYGEDADTKHDMYDPVQYSLFKAND